MVATPATGGGKSELFIRRIKRKSSEILRFRNFSGGDKRDRTADLLNAIQALSQLSYTPMEAVFSGLAGGLSRVGLIIIARRVPFVNTFFRFFAKLFGPDPPRPERAPKGGQSPPFRAYFRKPATICSSASASVRPRVMSFVICSPAILPMAASWTRLASTLFAVISGMAWT